MAFLVMDSHGPTVVVRLFYVLTGHMSGKKKEKTRDLFISVEVSAKFFPQVSTEASQARPRKPTSGVEILQTR